MSRRVAQATALLTGVLLLSGCATGVPTPAETPHRPVPSAAATPQAIEFAPLTGLLVPAGSLNHPSLAAKIDNHEDARPQWALNQTDLVFEELVEGGLTRYVAVWHSQIPEAIGPVRSIRPMDPDIISPLGGIVAYSGGQSRFVAMMHDTPVLNISADEDGTDFYRVDSRDAPHNELLKASAVVAAHADLAKPAVQFRYGSPAEVFAQALTPAARLDLEFSAASDRAWEWDAASQAWLRVQGGVADTVQDGSRTRAVNVVVVRVQIDWQYSPVPKTVLVGSGDALVAVGGKTMTATWSKDSSTAPIVLRAADGSPLSLLPGNTWIELVPVDGSVTTG